MERMYNGFGREKEYVTLGLLTATLTVATACASIADKVISKPVSPQRSLVWCVRSHPKTAYRSGHFWDGQKQPKKFGAWLTLQGPNATYEVTHYAVTDHEPTQDALENDRLALKIKPKDSSSQQVFAIMHGVESVRNTGFWGGYSVVSGKTDIHATQEEDEEAQRIFDERSQEALELCEVTK